MNSKQLLIIFKLLILHSSYKVVCEKIVTTSHRDSSGLDAAATAGSNVLAAGADHGKLLGDEPTSFFREQSLGKSFDQQVSFDQYINYAMRALALVAGYDNDLHRYDSKQDLIRSFARNHSSALLQGRDRFKNRRLIPPAPEEEKALLADLGESAMIDNELNQERCGLQLDMIINAASKLYASPQEFSRSKQLALIDYLDSFGGPGAQTMQGNFLWLGSQEQCTGAEVPISALVSERADAIGETGIETRYCVASFRSPNWRSEKRTRGADRQSGGDAIKLGVCLPKNCNSISYFRHAARIESLVKSVRLNQVPFSSYKLVRLFCLPDESSPLRQFSLSARCFILLLSSWLTAVLYFSLKYEYYRMKWLAVPGNRDPERFNASADNAMKVFAFRLSWAKLFSAAASDSSSSCQPPKQQESIQVFTVSTDVTDSTNIAAQVLANQQPSADEIPSVQNVKSANILASLSNQSVAQKGGDLAASVLQTALQQQHREQQASSHARKRERRSSVIIVNNHHSACNQRAPSQDIPTIDLSAIEGVKVLSMLWLIGGHTLLFFIRTIANGRDFWSVLKDARFMTIMAGIFPVDTFFTITGILTAYLKFNKNNGQAMGKLSYWLEAFIHRYLRFMPMYLLVFWYTRDVSEYIGSGPLWDYATADTSLRSTCKQESFSVPLLFQANFKAIDQHCVKPAWYLANDYQYLLLTPLFMGLIMRSTLLGYSVICVSILASLILQFLTVYHSIDMDDFGAIINFKPMFGTYVLKNLWKLYVLPYNRIPPYLIGLITGHMMYKSREIKNKNNNSEDKHLANDRLNQAKDSTFDRSHNSLASLATTNRHHKSTTTIISSITSSRPSQTRRLADYAGLLASYLCVNIWTPVAFLISIIYLPMITRISTLEGPAARIGTSSVIALMRFVWSLAIARLIYICATRFFKLDCSTTKRNDSFVIRFLSSPKWKPWSKIGLSALLIQWEIISYLAQIQTSAPNMTISFLLAMVLLCIVTTYVLALLIYLTLEYPLSQVEQLYVHPAIFCKN